MASPIEFVNSLRSRAFRRMFRQIHRSMLRVLVADIVVVGALALFAPVLLIPLVLVVAAIAARNRWGDRAHAGASERLPPGRWSNGTRPIHDPDFYIESYERFGSPFRFTHLHMPAACVVGVQEAFDLFNERASDLQVVPLAFNQYIEGGLVRWKEGEEHVEHRRLFQSAFGQQLVRANWDTIETAVTRSLQEMATDSHVDGVHPFGSIRRMNFALLLQLFFGITTDDPRYDEITELYETISVRARNAPELVHPAVGRLEELVIDALPDEDTRSAFDILNARTAGQIDRGLLTNLVYMLELARNDVSGLLLWAVKHAVDNPEVLEQLRQEPIPGGGSDTAGSLANRMVSETLRLEQSEHLFRQATADVEVGGYTIPSGWLIRFDTHASHRDADLFPDPNRYDPNRFNRRTTPAGYAPFGLDRHSCIGETLTRRVCAVYLAHLAHGYDVTVVDDGPRAMGLFAHWAPNDRFRIRLDRRGSRSSGPPS